MEGGGRPQRELRVLAFADLHLDRSVPWSTRATGEAMRVAQQVAFDAICAIAAAEADVLISAGDLYDYDRHHPDTGELLRGGFERLSPMPVVLIPGEADPIDGLSLYEHVKWSPNVHVLTTSEPTGFSPLPGLTVWAAADSAALAGVAADAGTFNLGVARGGGGLAGTPVELGGLQHLLVASSHHPSDGERETCPGAAYPVDPEDPPGGVVVLNLLEDGTLEVTRREIGTFAPQRPQRRFPTDGLAAYNLAAIGEEQTVRGEFVRTLLTPEESPVHLRRLALLSGLRALDGAAPEIDRAP